MEQYYSAALREGIRLLYFQADAAEFPEGVRFLERAVENEEPHAFYFLARCYGWGDGNVKEDNRKAKELTKRGIELGSDLCVLGADRMDILKGSVRAAMTGTLKDAFDGVLAMAEAGEPMAQYAIGLFYFWGDMFLNFQKPLKQDFEKCEKENAAEALKWFRRSAEQGCIPAFRNAFNSVRGGTNGVRKDPAEALRYAEAVSGRVDMRDYYHSIILEYQKLKCYDDAIRWCEKGAREGVADCAVDLGMAYVRGDQGVAVDYGKAWENFNIAARTGEAYGIFNVGRCYYFGWGCAQDYNEAVRCFERTLDSHPSAPWFLAQCYFWGRGTEVSYERAVAMMERQIRANENYPKELMGYCCLYGKGIGADPVRGKQLLEEAAQAGNGQAWMFLGEMFDRGAGVPEDIQMAVHCYQKAAEKKTEGAAEALSRYKKTLLGKWKRK